MPSSSANDLLHQIRLNGEVPRHIAIIMDGNGRWARQRGRPRTFGHRAGMRAVRQAVEAAGDAGVEVLTLYAFSQENWQRPPTEVMALMGLLELYVRREREELRQQGVQVRVIGELDRLPPRTRRAIESVVEHTADVPDPDLLIRTSGEMRISNFLLWQIAYTEVSVLPVLWPDFSREHLFNAILDFQRRERRFGRVLAS